MSIHRYIVHINEHDWNFEFYKLLIKQTFALCKALFIHNHNNMFQLDMLHNYNYLNTTITFHRNVN